MSREIVPYKGDPEKLNLIQTLDAGKMVRLSELSEILTGYLSQVVEGGRVRGTVIWVPNVEANEVTR